MRAGGDAPIQCSAQCTSESEAGQLVVYNPCASRMIAEATFAHLEQLDARLMVEQLYEAIAYVLYSYLRFSKNAL